ncbi:MAG: hypothetical protein HC896_15490 [Bacteroidales bacterium]|nr:hypothetical protein [Bacteroidales bacterium]
MQPTIASYAQAKENLAKGWNTWSNYSLGQHVLLPTGAAVNFGLYKKGRTDETYLNRFAVNKNADGKYTPVVRPGLHSYSGDYTELEIYFRGDRIKLETAAYGNDFYMLVTPVENDSAFPVLATLEGGIAWNKAGTITRKDSTFEIKANSSSMEFKTTQRVINSQYVNSIAPNLSDFIRQNRGF